MPNYRMVLVLGTMVCLLAGASAISFGETIPSQASDQVSKQASNQASNSEQTVWNLEHEYWRYVQDNNLAAYLELWHKDFLGWPSFNASPVGKDHITDWITSQTAKGLALKSIEFRPSKNSNDRGRRGGVLLDHVSVAGQGWQGSGAYIPHHTYVAQGREG